MEGNADTTAQRPTRSIAGVAWFIAFALPLALVALALAVQPARAAGLFPDPAPLAFEEGFELEDEEDEESEFALEACESAEEELEEGELSEAEAERICEEDEGGDRAAGSVAPEECLLRSAHARLIAFDSHKGVRLTVGYTAYEPTAATIDYRLDGGKGPLHLGTAKRHLGRSGVIRLTRTLGDSEMAKVEAARHFTVRLQVAAAPADCRSFETEQLTAAHASKRQTVWSQTD